MINDFYIIFDFIIKKTKMGSVMKTEDYYLLPQKIRINRR
jgi:hypothetical protein